MSEDLIGKRVGIEEREKVSRDSLRAFFKISEKHVVSG